MEFFQSKMYIPKDLMVLNYGFTEDSLVGMVSEFLADHQNWNQ